MSAIRIGIVGFGRIVELTHLPVLAKLPQFEVAGICDMTPQRRILAEKRGFRTFEKLDELLDADIEAVLVATPPSSHSSIVAAAIASGKHALIEKPAATSAEEADRLCRQAEATERVVTVFHNRRFDPDYELARSVIAGGELGTLRHVERRFHQFGTGASFGVQSYRPGWRNEVAYGGGALLDWGVHLVDQLLHLGLGRWQSVEASSPKLLRSAGDAEECVRAQVMLDSGVLLSIDIHFGSHASSPSWIVCGDRGTLQVDASGDAKLTLTDGSVRQLESPGSGGFRRDRTGTKRIYEAFAGKLREGGKLAVTLEEAAEGIRLLDAIRTAAGTKREVLNGRIVYGTPAGI